MGDSEKSWGGLKPAPKIRHPVVLDKGVVYALINGDFLTFDLSERGFRTTYFIEPLPDFIEWVGVFYCTNCGIINILNGEVEVTDADHNRQMGPEVFWSRDESFQCNYCNNDIEVSPEFNYYAGGWLVGLDVSGALLIHVEDFNRYIKEWHEYKFERNMYENLSKEFKNYLDSLIEYVDKTGGYIILIEGDDDLCVWLQILEQEYVDISHVAITKYGEGGINEAIKAVRFFGKPVLKEILHKLIIDSDNKRDEKIKELKEKGLKESEFHVLQKKEIESYLINAIAISKILSVEEEDVQILIDKYKAKDKEDLDKIFMEISGMKPNPQIKGLLLRALPEVPEELKSLSEEISLELRKQASIIQQYKSREEI